LERAVRIKLEAWRNIGRVLREMRKAGELHTAKSGARKSSSSLGTRSLKTLADHNISKKNGAAAGRLDALTERQFQARCDPIVARALRLIGAILKFEVEREVRAIDAGLARVIYADPPWQYSNSGLLGAAASHYPTLTTDEICGLRVPTVDGDKAVRDIAAGDAALFLWATNPLLPDALRVIDAWGFSYKTNFVWIKSEALYGKLGFYNLSRHELLLVATRGSFVPADRKHLPQSVIEAPTAEHSQKPAVFYELIEQLYPKHIARHAVNYSCAGKRGLDGYLDLATRLVTATAVRPDSWAAWSTAS
jgi:N6-adenosine-specific RNA methylase IME4